MIASNHAIGYNNYTKIERISMREEFCNAIGATVIFVVLGIHALFILMVVVNFIRWLF